jgi:hypothetical protein
MKKWLFVGSVGIVLLLATALILIPGELVISKITLLHCTIPGAYRNISDSNYWNNWWPGKIASDSLQNGQQETIFTYGDSRYSITKKNPFNVGINIQNKNYTIASSVEMLSLGLDSTIVNWTCTYPEITSNPFRKCVNFVRAWEIKNQMSEILTKVQFFLENPDHLYGINIRRSSTKDTLMVAAKYTLKTYPTTNEIYDFLNPLKKYIQDNSALQTSYPMLNVTKINNDSFQIMVAIPINKTLPGNDTILFRRMVPGNFYVTEITGGAGSVEKGFSELKNFVTDYQKAIIAIPFQLLVTDRRMEPDTTKWVTKIYMPVVK